MSAKKPRLPARNLVTYYEVAIIPPRNNHGVAFRHRKILLETFSAQEAEYVKSGNPNSTILTQTALMDSDGKFYRIASVKPLSFGSKGEDRPRNFHRRDLLGGNRVYVKVGDLHYSIGRDEWGRALMKGYVEMRLDIGHEDFRPLKGPFPKGVLVHEPLHWTEADWQRMVGFMDEEQPIEDILDI